MKFRKMLISDQASEHSCRVCSKLKSVKGILSIVNDNSNCNRTQQKTFQLRVPHEPRFSVKLSVAKGKGGLCRRDRISLAVEGLQNYEDICRRISSFPESDYRKRTPRNAPLDFLNETRISLTIDTYSVAATRRCTLVPGLHAKAIQQLLCKLAN